MSKNVYFIGIGGISMSGLAIILKNRGRRVSGSDRDEGETVAELREAGIHVNIGQRAENITEDIDLVVYTAAIHDDNPELVKARELGLEIMTRAELLGHIMEEFRESIAVCGTHGKTTTTSMIASILREYTDPTVTVGGMLAGMDTNVLIGSSDYFVAEACEYTNSFFSFYPKYNIILNIEEDHPDFFKDLADIRNSFHTFALNTKEDGVIFLHENIENPQEITNGSPCEIFTFGFSEGLDLFPRDIRPEDTGYSFIPVYKGEECGRVTLSVPGKINVSNALGAISVCMYLGIPMEAIIKGLKVFRGAKRRFEKKGTYAGATIIDDYAHHPTEVAATIALAKELVEGRLIVLFQPHTYTRTEALFDDFVDALSGADLILLSEIYAAREENVNNTSSKSIVDALKSRGKEAVYFSSMEESEDYLKKNLVNHDMLITMGAGNIYFVADSMLGI